MASDKSAKFDKAAFLKKHLTYKENMEYEPSELSGMLAVAKKIFEDEEMLLKVHTPVIVVGDIHGQVTLLFCIKKRDDFRGGVGVLFILLTLIYGDSYMENFEIFNPENRKSFFDFSTRKS